MRLKKEYSISRESLHHEIHSYVIVSQLEVVFLMMTWN
jgi:hypothetical protein